MTSDLLAEWRDQPRFKWRDQPRFIWGNDSLVDTSEIRRRYISDLQSADARDYAPLLAFARG